jgi:DNA-binding response OmpR family regulator
MKAHIFLIENERTSREALDEALLSAGYDVVLTADGLEAVDLLSFDRPDLVITELDMPNLNGQAVLAEVKKVYPETPVVVYTALATPEHEQELRQLGAQDFLSKTLALDEVLRRLAAVMR